ncbi:hypothetical protein YC2023_043902 [Brassica napus]
MFLGKHDTGGEEARVCDPDVEPLGVALSRGSAVAELGSHELNSHDTIFFFGR